MSSRRHVLARGAAVVPALVVVLGLGACSGGDRPSADELEQAIRGGESSIAVPDDQAACTADVLFSSSLSDEMLRAYVANEDHDMSDDERTEFSTVMDRLETECGFQQGAG